MGHRSCTGKALERTYDSGWMLQGRSGKILKFPPVRSSAIHIMSNRYATPLHASTNSSAPVSRYVGSMHYSSISQAYFRKSVNTQGKCFITPQTSPSFKIIGQFIISKFSLRTVSKKHRHTTNCGRNLTREEFLVVRVLSVSVWAG